MIDQLLGYKKVIRPSSLPSWQDCARRSAAVLFRDLLELAGFELRRRRPHIGACVGSGVHAAAAYTLAEKLETGEPGNDTEAEQLALAELNRRLDAGTVWDDATNNPNTAEKQTVRMVRSYRKHVAPTITPVLVEQRLEADLGDGFVVSGQLDALVKEKERLLDLKTGVTQRANGTQYGAYSMLYRAHGYTVGSVGEIYVPRLPISKEQPPPTLSELPAAVCEQEAAETIADLKRSVFEFIRRLGQGDKPPEMSFRANPSSVLCGEKFCPAWGTTFCRAHKDAK